MTTEKHLPARLSSADIGAPLHHQIFLILRTNIVTGRYGRDDLLPSEKTLTEMWGVSRATVRRAMLSLESEGLIERRQGRGTTVVYSPPISVAREGPEMEEVPEVRVLEYGSVSPPAEVRAFFALSEEEKVFRIMRVRESSRGLPVRLLTYYVPEAVGAQLSTDAFGTTTMVEILKAAGYVASHATEIVGATLADPQIAEQLQVKAGAALLELHRKVFKKRNAPLMYQIALIPPERHRIRIDLSAASLGLREADSADRLVSRA